MVKAAPATVLFFFGILSISGLAGCAATAEQPREVPAQVKALEQQDKYREAAIYYQRLAQDAKPPLRQDYQLNAVASLLKGNHARDAKTNLEQIDLGGADPGFLIRKKLLAAEIALQQREVKAALAELEPLEKDPLPAGQAGQFHGLRLKAYTQLNDLYSSTRERIALDQYLEAGEPRQQNRAAVLDQLARLTDNLLLLFQAPPGKSPATQGMDKNQQLSRLTSLIEDWRRHDLTEAELARVQALDARLNEPQFAVLPLPDHIALILPLSGRYAAAGEAVRDGIIAAHYSTRHEDVTPVLGIYDTGSDNEQTRRAYQQAVEAGAKFIIGPLEKEAVASLAGNELPVTTLALNYAVPAEGGPRGLFQFGLSPEDEAQQVAERAWNDGRLRALVLVPDNDWGSRISATFLQRWAALGGEIAAIETYDANKSDFSGAIRHAFNLDQSRQRHKQLGNVLGEKIEFTPRRRQDIDFIFVAALPRQARLLQPQLKFHYAGDLPVYSTSHAFSGDKNAQLDQDMDGMIIGDMPWTLGGKLPDNTLPDKIRQQWPNVNINYWRLYALGADAYALSAYLGNAPNRVLSYSGNTGRLSLSNNLIQRQLGWAIFKGGIPRPRE
ncbi:MAG: hypothetical protein A2V90_03460 [Gammaproteobacteria bacterium RBG_16_57_12]|nr:MAG: hypothetical protein A2V90_03460 [Gammaproteobacteria bacterium RBG_16_57_12]